MAKQVHYKEDARNNIFQGMQMVADAVKVTMGPKGRNVILAKSYGAPIITNDGVTVAKDIELENPLHNVGASMMKEAAEKTNKEAGDGTTTTVVLAHAMAREGIKYIKSGVNPFALAKGLHKTVDHIISELSKRAKPIKNKEEIKQVATISAQDEEVGELISEVMEEIGNDGTITVEEGNSFGLSKEIKTGMQFDQGYLSPYFVTDTQRMEAVVEKPYILISDKKISSLKEILPLLESVAMGGKKDLVLIADDIEGEALASLVLNKMRGMLNILAIKAPGFGDNKKELLKDIATVTGAILISEELGYKLDDATIDMLGKADKVISSKDHTIIVNGHGEEKALQERADILKAQMGHTKNEYDKNKLLERLAKLVGGVAIIKVGAATEMEMKNKKYKIEDALNATKAAVQEGIVAGGGISLVHITKTLDSLHFDNEDENLAIQIIKHAIQYPVIQIANNAGYKGDWVIEKIKEQSDFNHGFDAKTGEFKDLVKAGIIDPAKVTRVALENAVSTAAMFLTTDAMITELPEKKKEHKDSNMMDAMY